MAIRSIKSLTFDEFKRNNNFMHIVYDDACECASYWLEEYLHGAEKFARYEFGPCACAYFSLVAPYYYTKDFEAWLDMVQRDFCLLDDESEKMARKYIKLADVLFRDECGYITMKDKDRANVEQMVCDLKEDIEARICSRMQSEYDAFDDDEELYSYFFDMFDRNDEFESEYYIDDDGIVWKRGRDSKIA